MEITGRSFSVFSLTPSLPARTRFSPTFAKKKDIQDNNIESQQKNQYFFPQLKVSTSNLARAAIGVFGLGFIDAGYSGDWSRIGVITPQSEELLKLAALVVVPICVFFIFRVPKET